MHTETIAVATEAAHETLTAMEAYQLLAHSDHRLRIRTPPTVVVAEDDYDLRQLLSDAIRKDGCEVVEAWDGPSLLKYLRRAEKHHHRPDLIIADHQMPGHTGLEILQGLHLAGWATPVILITAFGDANIHAAADRHGAAAVFDKPLDVEALRAAVQVCLQDPTSQWSCFGTPQPHVGETKPRYLI